MHDVRRKAILGRPKITDACVAVGLCQEIGLEAKCLGKSSIAHSRTVGAIFDDRSLFSQKRRLRLADAEQIGEFARKWRARQESNLRPLAPELNDHARTGLGDR
jgi:hypothetical protein